jgi:hypothetical protein
MIYNFDEVYDNLEDAMGALNQNGSVLVEAAVADEMVSNDNSLVWEEHGSSDTIFVVEPANPNGWSN